MHIVTHSFLTHSTPSLSFFFKNVAFKQVFELIEKGYVSAETVLENVLRLSFKTLSPFSIEHITMVAVLCVFALGKDSRSPPPPTLHPLSELISACPNAWKPLVTKALPALTQRGASECFVIRWLWPYFRTVFLKEVNLVMFRSKLYDFVVDFSKTTGSNM